MAINYSPHIVSDGLVLCLDAANPRSYPDGGNIWYDLSGNGNNGTLNGPTFSNDNSGFLVFDGTDDYVNCGNSLNFDNSFSIGCWMKADSGTNSIYTKGLVSKYSTFGNYRQYLLGFNEENSYVNFGFSTNGAGGGATGNLVSSSNGSIIRNIWYNILGVFNSGSSVKIFINGELSSSLNTVSISHYNSNVKPLEIGASEAFDSGVREFNGNISKVIMYNRALSANEVRQNFNATRNRYGI